MAEDINEIKTDAMMIRYCLDSELPEKVSKVMCDLAEYNRQQEFIIDDLKNTVENLQERLNRHNIF